MCVWVVGGDLGEGEPEGRARGTRPWLVHAMLGPCGFVGVLYVVVVVRERREGERSRSWRMQRTDLDVFLGGTSNDVPAATVRIHF